ncbi:RNA 2'-phosphotransferase [Paraconexibacter sp. AEG42_29]|uniref:RNA 2'-phosphotransferase n=1 Tax=Paraconexibacter sp. AEG42_29 TaxID=2997339 RepID=UPI00339DA240
MSKFLSLVLRHRPQAAGLELDEAGWVDVDALLLGVRAAGREVTRGDLDRVVAESPKQRFAFDPTGTRIRAAQGHSVAVDLAYEPAAPPARLFHGTHSGALPAIHREGLRSMKRHHVHLSLDPETAEKVGSRRGAAIVLQVDAAGMAETGTVFYRASNGVWLCDHIPSHRITFPGGATSSPP